MRGLSNERVAKTVELHHPGLFFPHFQTQQRSDRCCLQDAAFIVVIIHSGIAQKTQSGLMLFLIFWKGRHVSPNMSYRLFSVVFPKFLLCSKLQREFVIFHF